MLAEIARLEQREKELATPNALRGLIEPGADVARLLLTPTLLGELRITPSGPGKRLPAQDRIQWCRE